MNTEAGKRMLALLPGADSSPWRDSWERSVAAIEAEAVAAERARITEAVQGMSLGGYVLRAAVLAIVNPEEAEG